MVASGLSPDGVRLALDQLEKLGIASNDTVLTAYVHSGVERSSLKRLEEASSLEAALIELLREVAPDMGSGDESVLHLRHVSQRLKDEGHRNALPHVIRRLLESLSKDGVDEQGGVGSIRLRRWNDPDTIQFWLQREWDALELGHRTRRAGAQRLLEHLLGCLPSTSRGTDLLAETTLGKLQEAIASDLLLKSTVKNPAKLRDRALLWLHEQEVIRLNKGLAVFRPAMTIRLGKDKRMFVKADFAPLQQHYDEQVTQIHVMAEYAQRGLTRMADALLLTMDYFRSGSRDVPEEVAGGSGEGTRAADHAGIVATDRRRVEEPESAANRGGRSRADQRADSGGPGVRQDASARASHRLPGSCSSRESAQHHCVGLQPARRPRDPASPVSPDR